MNAVERGMILLLKSAVTGEKYELPEGFELTQAYALMKKHNVLPLGYQGAKLCGADPQDPVMAELQKAYFMSVITSERQMKGVAAICRAFDENRIDYMPLKGCNLKKLYPLPELRTMGDADILIRVEQYERIVPIMEALGFDRGVESDHELIWTSKNLRVELHKRLIPSNNEDYFSYYGDGWQLAKESEGTHFYMTPEDEYIYLFTHFTKHYRNGGIGCRHVLDLWIDRRAHPDLDFAYIGRELKTLELDQFHHNMEVLGQVWFEGREMDDRTEFMSGYIVKNGVWGSFINKQISCGAENAARTKSLQKGKFRYCLEVIFPTRQYILPNYPILRKYPGLLPAMWVKRWFDVIRLRRGSIRKRMGAMKDVTEEKIESFEQGLEYVGLQFRFRDQS